MLSCSNRHLQHPRRLRSKPKHQVFLKLQTMAIVLPFRADWYMIIYPHLNNFSPNESRLVRHIRQLHHSQTMRTSAFPVLSIFPDHMETIIKLPMLTACWEVLLLWVSALACKIYINSLLLKTTRNNLLSNCSVPRTRQVSVDISHCSRLIPRITPCRGPIYAIALHQFPYSSMAEYIIVGFHCQRYSPLQHSESWTKVEILPDRL